MITSFLAKRGRETSHRRQPARISATGLLAAVAAGGVALALAAGPASAQPVPAPPIPGVAPGAAISPDLVTTDLVYTGTDHRVWSVDLSPMSQNVPESLGGKIAGGPAAAWVSPGTLSPTGGLAVFGRGPDNRLWWRQQTSSGWSSWASLGGTITSRPTAVYWQCPDSEILGVFARGADGAVWGRVEYHVSGHTTWTSWSSYGSHLLTGTGPVVAFTRGRIFLAAVGTDHAVWVRHNSPGGGWRPWHSIGGHTTVDPALATPADGVVVAFARGSAGTAPYNEFHGQTAGVTAGWHSIGGALTSGLTAIPNQVEQAAYTGVFALGPDHQPWEDTGTWPALTGWQQVTSDLDHPGRQ
jgi:hypothetical protein